MCEKCDAIREAVIRESELKGDVLHLQAGPDPVLTYSKDGRLTLHTSDVELLKQGMGILSAALEKMEAEATALQTKQQLLSMAVGALHGWMKSIDPDADKPRGTEGEGKSEDGVLSVNMPTPKSKS